MRLCHPLLAGVGALCLVPMSACSLAEGMVAGDEPEPVVISMPAWPGGQANAAVAAYVLENELGVPVQRIETDQEDAWDGLGSGSIQAILEDWGAVPDKTELYVERKEYVVDAGGLGITGHVGWYIPRSFAEEHPQVLDWHHLNDFAEVLGGRLLQADPQFATRDEAIIEDLGLDLRPAAAGSEDALVERIYRAGADGTPLLTYFWQPHWLSTEVELAEVELPGYYPRIELRKYLNAEFAEEGGEAADFLRDFSWSEEDQNEVAQLIAHDGLTPTAAAERWVTEHPDTVAAWLD
ncbi:glycine betaine ABC transporter substrate-binding protein [Streptomyces litchfieldiae]|uniref:Glycine betaine ABC transporter substrate-binding protein n=1 Tax=Streptomyces litchfieldiae TaxID=3075543 RepID=A0ABU2N035_9ACTN|nr:glycine betaine ABC transporter substrate-binding protein [Streptomyces sp. DSM 44938]MDT0347255.1 glycine betaine ABC transporter substrate-binding protein [Streptomyces sp. DSM 44938]